MKLKLLPNLLLLFLWSCNPPSNQSEQAVTSLSKEIKELRPGILEGYLFRTEYPNSLFLVPPPPEEGSKAFEHDQEIAAKAEVEAINAPV